MKNKKVLFLLFGLCALMFSLGYFFVSNDSKLSKNNNETKVEKDGWEIAAEKISYKYVSTGQAQGTKCTIGGSFCTVDSNNHYLKTRYEEVVAECGSVHWGIYKENMCYVVSGNQAIWYYATKEQVTYENTPSNPSTSTGSYSCPSGFSSMNFTCTNGDGVCSISGGTLKNVYGATATSCDSNPSGQYCYKTVSTNVYGLCTNTGGGSNNTTSSTTTTTTTTKTTAPTEVIPIPDVVEEDLNAYYYAKEGARYSGASIYCGDKIYVTRCDLNGYCTVTKINGVDVKTSTKVYKDKLSTTDNSNSCSSKVGYVKEGTNTYTNSSMSVKKQSLACGTEISLTPSLGDRCTDGKCKVTIKGEEQYIYLNNILRDKPTCSTSTTTDDSCKSTSKLTDFKGKDDNYKICFKKVSEGHYKSDDGDNIRDKVTCADNYNKTAIEKENTCKNATGNTCYVTYSVSCDYIERPSVSSTGSIVRADGYGTIALTATDNGSYGIKGYYISSGLEPTINSEWTAFNDNSYVARENKMAGTYFVWVMNNKDRISYPSMSRIYDADTTTTITNFSVKSTDGADTFEAKPLNDETTAYGTSNIVDSKYVRLSNTLKNDSILASFDSLKTGYELTVNRSKVAIYATLTSNDASFVEGYEPRTVDLNYGRNVQLIRIVNKQGKIRTYTFIINRVDDRDNNNFLSDIKISAGKIEFNPYITDYTVKVSKKVTKVSINGTLESKTSAFVAGFGPRTIELTSNQTSAVLKTVSAAGIVRSYVVTFVKDTNEDLDNNKTSTYLSSLSIPGTSLVFDRDTTSYTVSVGYEVENLPVYAFAESENATVKIIGDSGFRVGNNQIEITVTNNKKTKIYTIYVIRKESGLTVANNTDLNTLTIKGYNLDFKPDVLDYSVKIKRERTLLITATPSDDRAEVYMYGNNDLTAFSIVKVKVIAENGDTKVYSINIEKDKYNKKLEITSAIVGGVILVGASIIIIIKRNKKKKKDYLEG